MNFRAIIILLVTFAVYFGMHTFLYYSILNFFSITEQKIKWILAGSLFVLAVGLFVIMILLRFSSFFLIKYIYLLISFWTGIVATLVLSFALVWLLVLVFKLSNLKLIFGILAIAIPVLYGVYGVWNALTPNIKNVDVNIVGLPENWQGKKIVHLSDVHLGRVHGVGFAEKVVGKVNDLHPDLVLITGDLFDGMGSKVADFVPALNKLESTYGTYYVTGNHEVYLGVDRILARIESSKINILDNQIKNIDGLQLVGLSYPKFGELRDSKFLETIDGFDSGLPNILMYHAPISIGQNKDNVDDQHTDIYWSPDTNFDIVKEHGINLQLSGHTHAGQVFPYNLMADLIYKGYNSGLKTEGDFNIYINSGVGTWGPPMRTGTDSEIAVIHLH